MTQEKQNHMLFNDLNFLFVFLPLVAVCTLWLVPRRFRIYMLIAASLVFYGQSGWEHALMLLLSVLWVHFITRSPAIEGSSWRLALAILFPASALLYFKYSNFILQDVLLLDMNGDDRGFSLFHDALLPAGISFFTFQLIGFSIDRYRGVLSEAPLLKTMMLYVSFFPQLIAGPIVRLPQVSEAIGKLSTFRPDRQDWNKVLSYVAIGLGYKVLIADSLHHYLAPIIKAPEVMGAAGMSYLIPAYSFQIYFDFYGYSLIAIGLGHMFGFTLPVNFRTPYAALNPQDFWRRWHISLSYWIRDYLYLPLGGNQHYVRNILIIFAVCGLWHGAGFSFIVWGLFHGVLVILYHLNAKAWDSTPKPAQWAVTFVLVSFAWLFFAFEFEGLSSALASVWQLGFAQGATISLEMMVTLFAAALICFGVKAERLAENNHAKPVISFAWGGLLGSVLFLSLLFVDRSETFIYFRF